MGRVIPLCIAVMGAYWAYQGWFEYGFWAGDKPGGGFLAVIVGTLTALFSIVELIKHTPTSVKLEKRHALPVIFTIVMLLLVPYLGMILSFGLLIIGWLILVEKYPKPRAVIIGAGTTVCIYVIFRMFFHVPFPTGFLGI